MPADTTNPIENMPRCSVCGAWYVGFHSCGGSESFKAASAPLLDLNRDAVLRQILDELRAIRRLLESQADAR